MIYTGICTTPLGKFKIAVDSDQYGAYPDILTAAMSEIRCHPGLIRVKEVKKSNRIILKSMEPIKSAKDWAWIKKEIGRVKND